MNREELIERIRDEFIPPYTVMNIADFILSLDKKDRREVTENTPDDALVVSDEGDIYRCGHVAILDKVRLYICFDNFPVTDGKCEWDESDFPLNVKFMDGTFGAIETLMLFNEMAKSHEIVAAYPVRFENE